MLALPIDGIGGGNGGAKNFRSITSELILAVDEEIQAIKSSGGSDRVGVHAGE